MPRTLQGKVELPPWDEIRRLYETTPIGVPSLQKKYGFASRTTINRRKAKEGWKKQVDELISVAAAEQIVADIRREQEAQAPAPEPEPDPAVVQAIQEMRIYDPVPESDPAPEPASDEAEHVRAADVGRSGMVPSVEDLESRRDAVVVQMAGIHADRIRAQLTRAGEMQQVGTGILRLIMAATVPANTTDGVTLALKQQAVMNLCGVNPDRETLAGLLKAACDILSKGIGLERQVLGIATPEKTKVGVGVVITNNTGPAADPSSPGKVLKSLDTKSAWKMRELLAEASRAARRQQTGQEA